MDFFLSCYTLAFFLDFRPLPSKNYRCIPAHNNKKYGSALNKWHSLNQCFHPVNTSLSQKFFLRHLSLETFPHLCKCHISKVTITYHIFLKFVSAIFIFPLNDSP